MNTLIQRSREKTPAEKAYFHQESGAGKSRVTRKFFGLSQDDEAWLEQELDTALDVNLRKSEG